MLAKAPSFAARLQLLIAEVDVIAETPSRGIRGRGGSGLTPEVVRRPAIAAACIEEFREGEFEGRADHHQGRQGSSAVANAVDSRHAEADLLLPLGGGLVAETRGFEIRNQYCLFGKIGCRGCLGHPVLQLGRVTITAASASGRSRPAHEYLAVLLFLGFQVFHFTGIVVAYVEMKPSVWCFRRRRQTP